LRFGGITGAIASFTAILAPPLLILLALLELYGGHADVPQIAATLNGIAAVAAGLVAAMAWRMAQPLLQRSSVERIANLSVVALSILAITALRWHLLPVLLIGGGLGVFLASRYRG
jgi:chromate transporter